MSITIVADAAHSGEVWENKAGAGDPVWSDFTLAGGNHVAAGAPVLRATSIWSATLPNWQALFRGLIGFDVRAILLPISPIIITQAVLSLYGTDKMDALLIHPSLNIYGNSVASGPGGMQIASYGGAGSTPYCDIPISYNNWLLGDWNSFTLNNDGLNALATQIGLPGWLWFTLRNPDYDTANVAPFPAINDGISQIRFNTAAFDITKAPKLVVDYIFPPIDPDIMGSGNIKKKLLLIGK